MPYKTNYENTIIYKLCCKDPSITDIYIGSTSNFKIRKSNHKTICNNPNDKAHNQYKYQVIREKGGWDNWDMIEIRKVNCKDKREAEREERNVIEELKPTLNKNRPNQLIELGYVEYQKEYREENKIKIQEYQKGYQKEYYNENKDKINIHKKEKNICLCSGCYTTQNKSIHYKTKKHQEYIFNQNLIKINNFLNIH